MFRYMACAALILSAALAQAQSDVPPITSVEMKEVPYRHPANQTVPVCGSGLGSVNSGVTSVLDLNPNLGPVGGGIGGVIGGGLGIGLGDIITIGNTLWNIVNAGKPVVTVVTPEASAFPRGITCWTDLETWQPPSMHEYEVNYKTMFGMTPVKLGFALHYTYGGSKDGVGKYLANVTIMPTTLTVGWGYTFDASVEAEQAINVGTNANPVAGLEINLKYTVKTVLKESVDTISFFVQGDGTMINNNKGL